MYRFFVLSAFILFSEGKPFAQDKLLFTFLPDQRSRLDANSLQKLKLWEQQDSYLATDFIDVADLNAVRNGTVKFTLPGITDTLYATVTSAVQRKDSSLVWSAAVGCYEGRILLIAAEKGVYGYITYLNTNYLVRTLAGGVP